MRSLPLRASRIPGSLSGEERVGCLQARIMMEGSCTAETSAVYRMVREGK